MNPYRSHLIEKEEEKGEAEEPETIKGNRSGKKEYNRKRRAVKKQLLLEVKAN
mgnify:CR=1 FL=1